MSPVDALDAAIQRGGYPSLFSSFKPRPGGIPGEVIAKLDAETREALTRLTSEHIRPGRAPTWAAWLGYTEASGQGISKLKMEYDAKHWRRR